MAKVRWIEYGSDKVSLFAEDGQFDLVIGSIGVIASTKTKQDMGDVICEIRNDLHDILWELESYSGFFAGFDTTDPEQEETKEEGASA